MLAKQKPLQLPLRHVTLKMMSRVLVFIHAKDGFY